MSQLQSQSQMNDSVANTFDAMVAGYERYAEPLTIQFAREALFRSGGVTKGEYLIDMGAGTGALALEAAKAGAKVLAVDISPGMVARLSERLAIFPGNEARVMNGASLDLTENAEELLYIMATHPPHRVYSELQVNPDQTTRQANP